MEREQADWPGYKIIFWGAALVLVACWRVPFYLEVIYPRGRYSDFLQDWASARYHLDGLPVYTNLREAARRYLQLEENPAAALFTVNAHPPTSILFALPLAPLDYPGGFLIWSLLGLCAFALSLWLVVTGLELHPSPWALLPFFTLLLLCHPFYEQVYCGQWGGLLLLLIVLAWRADCAERPWLAGALIGIATAVKLSPGFLFLYFLMRGNWRAVASGILIVAGLTAVTAAALGVGAYCDYVGDVVPHLTQSYSSQWPNFSLPGYWHKLFAGSGQPGRTISLYHDPAIARLATLTSTLVVVGLTAWAAWRARSRSEEDLAFAVALVGMLLVSPITWTHYCLVLLMPLALWFRELPPGTGPRWLLWTAVVILWIPPALFWVASMQHPVQRCYSVTTLPSAALTGAALPTYALVGLFVVGLAALTRREDDKAP